MHVEDDCNEARQGIFIVNLCDFREFWSHTHPSLKCAGLSLRTSNMCGPQFECNDACCNHTS